MALRMGKMLEARTIPAGKENSGVERQVGERRRALEVWDMMSAGKSILFRSLTLHSYLHATFLDLNIKLKWGTWVIKIIMLCTVYEKAPEGKCSLGSSASHLGPVKLGQCKEMPSKYQPKCQPVRMHAFMRVTCTRAHRKLAQKCLGA